MPVWLLLAGVVVNRLGHYIQIYLVLFLTNRGFSAASAGLALGAYGAGSVLGVMAGGSVSDRLGYRWTIVGSTALGGVLVVSLLYLDNFWLVILVATVVGAAAQAYRPASSALLVELTPQHQHVMVFAVYRLAFNIGTTGGPLLGALLIAYSYALMFYVDAFTSIVFALLALSLPRRGSGGAGDADVPDDTSRRSYLSVLSDRRFVLFMLALFLNAVVYIQHISVLPLYMTVSGHSSARYALLLSLNSLIVICLELPFTRFVQRMPARLAVAIGIGLVGVGTNLYVAGPAFAVLVFATVVRTVGEMTGTPTASAYPGWVAKPGLRGRYIAAAAIPQQIGYALGPAMGVALWTVWPAGVWWMCGLLTVVAVAATLTGMIDTGARQPEPDDDRGDADDPDTSPVPAAGPATDAGRPGEVGYDPRGTDARGTDG